MGKKILSFDGGGIRGVISVVFLNTLEKDTGIAISQNADMLAGTSTGSIIAAALTVGMTPQNILDFYTSMSSEIFIPKAPSMKLVDLFEAIAPDAKQEIIGIRPGEKLHEILLTEQEALHSLELTNYYIVLPEYSFYIEHNIKKYQKNGKKLKPNFRFTSDTNKKWLTIKQFKDLIK